MNRRRAIWLAVVACAIAALVVAEVLTSGDGGAGRPAPELPREVLVGPRADLASLRGKPAVVNFWASWCDPCKEEAPELRRFDRSLDGEATLVGVDWGDAAASAREFIEKARWRYPILRDPSQKVGLDYGLNGLPTTFVLDAEGDIVRTLQGPQTYASLRQALSAAE